MCAGVSEGGGLRMKVYFSLVVAPGAFHPV